MYKTHHTNSNMNMLYAKRQKGRRGLLQTKGTYKEEIINITEYLNTKYEEDRFVNIVKIHEGYQTNMNPTIKNQQRLEKLNI